MVKAAQELAVLVSMQSLKVYFLVLIVTKYEVRVWKKKSEKMRMLLFLSVAYLKVNANDIHL